MMLATLNASNLAGGTAVTYPQALNQENTSLIMELNNHLLPFENRTDAEPTVNPSEVDAFVYIVIVLMFYAVSMVLLMVKYVRSETREASFNYYYVEFVKRERFAKPGTVLDERTSQTHEFLRKFMAKENIKKQQETQNQLDCTYGNIPLRKETPV